MDIFSVLNHSVKETDLVPHFLNFGCFPTRAGPVPAAHSLTRITLNTVLFGIFGLWCTTYALEKR